jgi:hypothetical protein
LTLTSTSATPSWDRFYKTPISTGNFSEKFLHIFRFGANFHP